MKAVFFDVDGTLIEGTNPDFRYMTATVKDAIRKVQTQGDKVFICSGRSLSFLDEKIRDFGFDGYVLLNGAVVYYEDKLIYHEELDKSFVKNLCSICDEYKMQYSLHGEVNAYVKAEFIYLKDRLAKYGIYNHQLTANYNLDEVNIYKLEIDSPHYEDRKYVIDSLPEDMNYIEDANHNYCHVEVYAKKNSKATGVLKVLECLNIDVKDSFAFGNEDNDIEMLSTVGFGMAMANGSLNARNSAKAIVPSVFENGVAYGIEKYILNK